MKEFPCEADSGTDDGWMRPSATYTHSLRPMRTLLTLTFACALLGLPGCLYAGGRTVREVGPQITTDSIAFIELGTTPVDWVEATFGEPNNRVCTLDGAEILRYDCDVRTTEGSYVFMLIASSSNTIERTSWWFEVRNSKVVRVWGEGFAPETVTADRNAPEVVPAPADAVEPPTRAVNSVLDVDSD